MITEGRTVFSILTDNDRYPETRKNLLKYSIDVKGKKIRFELGTKLPGDIERILGEYYNIRRKK